MEVFKIGRTTGHTLGRITAFAFRLLPVDFEGNLGVCSFDDVLEVEGLSGEFSAAGDSGSFILTDDARPVGLLFAGSETGGSNGGGVTNANLMATVLQDLDLSLV